MIGFEQLFARTNLAEVDQACQTGLVRKLFKPDQTEQKDVQRGLKI